ncbi:hypothetical protein RHGRI_013267 [Rhododendron griersonianum]|uniref:Glycosyltransferase N-terminal domain-containing protein n=1 Tax=Rhododendron griersonianum TaxID=479676 RepID=A0AAV6K582_9ERIC|nr:hypothetical protein RHGRI_013267 [Rhododendron griersonianum]
MMEYQQRKTNVFMFPWLAHGHISPFLELAKTLSKRNFNIYLCSTRVNLSCIEKKLAEKYSHSITLVEIKVPTLPGLPQNFHTTKNLPPHLMPTLKTAFDRSANNLSKLLKTFKPDLLIYDTIQPWAPVIASKHDIPAVAFVATSATMTSFMLHRYKYPGTEFPFEDIYLNDHEDGNLVHLIQSSENHYKGKNRFFECLRRSSGMILIKSLNEIEGKYIDHLSLLAKKKIVPVEIGVGVEAKRDGSGKLVREEVARVIKEVVVDRGGDFVRKRERQLSEKARMREEERMDGVVEELLQVCRKRKNIIRPQINGLLIHEVVEMTPNAVLSNVSMTKSK